MESTQEAPRVAVAENMVSITFPGREPCLLWSKAMLFMLIVQLHTAYAQWDDRDRAKAKEKANAAK